jgi:hypothetical protein
MILNDNVSRSLGGGKMQNYCDFIPALASPELSSSQSREIEGA